MMSGNNKVLHTQVLAYMYPQMVYHADVRAREMELAADRQMGCSCSPLGRMISRMITKCNGIFLFYILFLPFPRQKQFFNFSIITTYCTRFV